MPPSPITFTHTAQAANKDRLSKWKLIEAIAWDAVENDVPISGIDSCVAAKEALTSAGNEYADSTVKKLCVVARFDHESLPEQRKTWRRYGWSSIYFVSAGGLSPEAGHDLLKGRRKTQQEIIEAVRTINSPDPDPEPEPDWDAEGADLVNRLNKVLMDFARYAEKVEQTPNLVLGAHAALGLEIYKRITERQLDAEIRQLLESAEVE